ncbi:MAG: 3'(2'),5'-bisphosphate nucleotidase CysQ [Proteobacteria bacterium]|nr:3'(2'),5'-bisphosphate nucleotidase CysQ [Pseudomonadota bacterium]
MELSLDVSLDLNAGFGGRSSVSLPALSLPRPSPAAEEGRRLAEIAEEAAALIRPYWRAGVQAERKADASPVTEADRRAEALILERLAVIYPGVAVVGEEGCADCGTPDSVPARFFLVDPLDGTRGFVSGSDEFTVNIALIEDGRPVAGAVATPADGRLWLTTKEGAVLREGGRERGITVRARPEEALGLVSLSCGNAEAERLGLRHGFLRWRAMNSSLKLVTIAEGSADVYPRTGPTSEWDIAAGQAVLEAAGGAVLTADGTPLPYGKAQARFLNPPFTATGGR